VHTSIAATLPDRGPRLALLSGFGPDEAGAVIGAYAACGLRQRRRVDAHGWVVALLET
jgi:hypothetical protein